MKIGIKIKLAVILSGLLLLTIFSLGITMIAHQRSSLEAQMRSLAGTITSEFANNSKMPLLQKDSLALNLLVQSILKYPGIFDAYVLNENFNIEGHKDIREVGREYYGDKAAITASKGAPPWVLKEERGAVTFVSPIMFKGTTVGYSVVTFSDSFIAERVRLAMTSVAVIGVFAIIVVSLISIPLASTLLRPIFRLFKGTKEIAVGNFDYRIPEMSKDEIGDLVTSFNTMASELKKKEILKGVFNRYVSQHVADEILKDPERIQLGGGRRDVTVFFADIRGFTSLSRQMSPEETVELLNRYFTVITEIVFKFEGTVDKFIGDAVMGVFGSPIRNHAHLQQGIKAAFAIKKGIEDLNRSRERLGLVPLQIGIGVGSGEVIVGNMGSAARMEYTAVGDAVNLAARLADLARGGDILVSEQVYELIRDHVEVEILPEVDIKGIERRATLYNILGLVGQWKKEVDETVNRTISEMEGAGIAV